MVQLMQNAPTKSDENRVRAGTLESRWNKYLPGYDLTTIWILSLWLVSSISRMPGRPPARPLQKTSSCAGSAAASTLCTT